MQSTREQFEIQSRRAQSSADFYGHPLALVMVREAGYPTRISIIGAAISPTVAETWKRDGANVRTIKTIKPTEKA